MKTYHVLNLGAGVQSTALYLMFLEGMLQPQINVAIFADTQEEPDDVYTHLYHLQSLNGPPIWRRTKGKLGDHLSCGVNSTGGRFASIPAFTCPPERETYINKNGRVAIKGQGKIRRQCTKEYKVEVVETAIRRELLGRKPRQRIPKDVLVIQSIGISLDEAGRSNRILQQPRFSKKSSRMTVRFPLLELGWTRKDCLTYLAKKLNYTVTKSACVFCPFKDDNSWLRLKTTDPVGWARAVEIDNALRIPGNVVNRGLNQQLFVHRSCLPLGQVQFEATKYEAGQFTEECEGMCGN